MTEYKQDSEAHIKVTVPEKEMSIEKGKQNEQKNY